MLKSYKQYNHEYCNSHVVIFFDETVSPNRIELWSDQKCVCGAYRSSSGVWKLFAWGPIHSKMRRRHITWFTQQPKQSHCVWKLSYECFKQIEEKCRHGVRYATDKEVVCIYDLIRQYMSNGKRYPGFE